jgi:hypothetical protein
MISRHSSVVKRHPLITFFGELAEVFGVRSSARSPATGAIEEV